MATNVAFAFAREKLALGSGGSGWVVHGRLHSLLSPFAHGYFILGTQWAKSIENVTKYSRRDKYFTKKYPNE